MGGGGGGGWKPSPELFPEVEIALKAALPKAAARRGSLPDWGSYTFQYQGVTPLVGKRYLLVNAFCDDPGHHPDFRTKWVKVMDGGACFFLAKYDPAAHALYDVLVNGVA